VSAVKHAGTEVELGGRKFTVPPLTLGALEEFQRRIAVFETMAPADQATLVLDLSHRALKRNYPELTREELAELLDMNNMFDIFLALMSVTGLLKGPDDPKATAAASGTGSPSTPTSAPASGGPSSIAGTASPSLN